MPRHIGILHVLIGVAVCIPAAVVQAQISVPSAPLGGGISVRPVGGIPLGGPIGPGARINPLPGPGINTNVGLPNVSGPQGAAVNPVRAISQPAQESHSAAPVASTSRQTPETAESARPETKSVPVQTVEKRSPEKVKTGGGPNGKGEGGDPDDNDGKSFLSKIPWWVWLILVLILLGAMDSRK